MKHILSFGFISLVLLFASCQKKEIDMPKNASKAQAKTYTAIIEPSTKAEVDINTGEFSWTNGDQILIISSDGDTETVNIAIDSEKIASFTTTIANPKYAVFPANIASDYTGGELTEIILPATYGSYETAHSSSLNAPMVADISSEQSLANFRHIASVVKVTVKDVPAGINKMMFTALGNAEAIIGKFDIDMESETPTINYVAKDDKTGHGDTATFYFLANESTCDMTFYVPVPLGLYDEGFGIRMFKRYLSDKSDTKFMERNDEEARVLNRKDLAIINLAYSTRLVELAANGPANSYIVSESGTYSFPTIKSNSWDFIEDVDNVVVAWESYNTTETISAGDLITSVSLNEKKNLVTFNASAKKGNALIAVRDASNKVLWSWHIWLTDQPKDQVYRNNAGTMMDRNLGATSALAEDGAKTLGLFYQWGRKDPFLNSGEIGSTTPAKSANHADFAWATFAASAYNSTVANSITMPTKFMYGRATNATTAFSYDWNAANTVTTRDNTLWAMHKSQYDPCPPGYRVPDSGNIGIWRAASPTLTKPSSGENGYDFGSSSTGSIFTDDANCYYPNTGQKNHTTGNIQLTTAGRYWSRTPNSNNAVAFKFDTSSITNTDAADCYRAKGMAVRCLKRR